MWYVYILLCHDSSLYTGVTNDVTKRFHQHSIGKGASYTASHKPVCIVYTHRFKTKSLAMKREYEIKQWPRRKKIRFLHLAL